MKEGANTLKLSFNLTCDPPSYVRYVKIREKGDSI